MRNRTGVKTLLSLDTGGVYREVNRKLPCSVICVDGKCSGCYGNTDGHLPQNESVGMGDIRVAQSRKEWSVLGRKNSVSTGFEFTKRM